MKQKVLKISAAVLIFTAPQVLTAWAFSRLSGLALLPFFAAGFCLLCLAAAGVLAYRLLKLGRSLRQYEEIVQNLPINIAVTDQSGRLLWHHAEHDSGNKNFMRKNAADLAGSPEDRERLWQDVRDTFLQRTARNRSFASLRRLLFFRRMASGVFGRETVLFGSWDASPLYAALENLEKLKQRYTALLNSILVGVMILDRDGKILEINNSGVRLLNLEADEIIGMECARVFHPVFPEAHETFAGMIDGIARNGGCYEFPEPIPMSIESGREIPIYLKCESIDDADGKPEMVMVFFRDHSAKEKTKLELREKKQMFELSMSLTGTGYFQYNPRTREMHGEEGCVQYWPLKNGCPLPEQTWVHRDDLAVFSDGRKRLLAGQEKVWSCVYRSEYSGHTIWYRLNALLIPDENGENLIAGTIQNISELRETILGNDENAFMLRMIMKSLPCIFFIKDITDDYRYVAYSDKGYEIFGFSPEDVIGKTDFEVFGASAAARTFRAQDKAANDAKKPTEGHSDVPDRNGRLRHFHTIEVAYPTGDGRKLLFGICFDETEEEVNRKKLLHLQGFYRELLDHLPVAVLAKDADDDFRYVIWNRLLEQHTGYAAEQVLGKTDFEIEPYPGQQKAFRELDLKSVESGTPMQFEQPLTSATGRDIIYRAFKMPLHNGEKTYTVETCLDISSERKLEQEQHATITRLNEQIAIASIVNTCLRRLNREPDFDQAVKALIQIVGVGIGADRCCIYRYSGDRRTVNCAFEWVRDGIPPRKLRHLDESIRLPRWDAELANRQIVKIDNVEHLPPEQQKIVRSFMETEEIHSLMCCGLFTGEQLDGWIYLDCVSGKHAFSESDIRLLSDAISIFQLARQRKQITDKIEENAALQKMIIDTIALPVVLLNADSTIVHANPAALKMMGHTLDEVLKSPCCRLICRCEQPPEKYCPLQKILRDRKSITSVGEVNGISYTINATPILHRGRVVQVLESFIDMTEVNKSKELLRKTARDAEAAAKAKSLFLSTMSHELRTPLNAVIGFAELLQLDGMSAQEKQDALKSIQLSGSVLLQLINDVLDLSKLEAGQMKISLRKTDLRTMLDEMRCIFQQKLKDNNLSFLAELPEDLPLLYLDGPHVRQILLNILGNAVKFTPKGGITVSVLFKKNSEQRGDLSIQIRDTGIGISPDYIDKVFNPFVQQESERGLMHKGTGLGLPICKRLAEQMNGTLTLQSAVGRGSCFTVNLPDLRYETAAAVTPENTAAATGQQKIHARLLLVDDVQMNLKVLETMARKLGAETRSAVSGEAALEILAGFHPDMILTDMWMPEMNGDELARRIKNHAEWRDIPIVAATADTEFGTAETRALFQGILIKPITMERLRTALLDQCARKESGDAQ